MEHIANGSLFLIAVLIDLALDQKVGTKMT